MREWIINEVLILPEEVDAIEREAKLSAKQAKERAWKAFMDDVRKDQVIVSRIIEKAIRQSKRGNDFVPIRGDLVKAINPTRLETMRAAKKTIRLLVDEDIEAKS